MVVEEEADGMYPDPNPNPVSRVETSSTYASSSLGRTGLAQNEGGGART